MVWNPPLYMRFGAERTRPALELAARIPDIDARRIVDLGCGPGNATEILTTRWPDAEVTGLDSSDEMIAAARNKTLSAAFAVADFETWSPDVAPDVIFSNAALHWSRDIVGLAVRLFGALAPGGVLAFQIPQNFDRPSHVIPHAMAGEARWVAKLAAARWFDPAAFPQALTLARPLAAAGAALDIWTTDYLHVLRGEHPVFDWVSATALQPFLTALNGAEREAFEIEAKSRYAAAYPPEPDGTTLFPFRRLFVIARRG